MDDTSRTPHGLRIATANLRHGGRTGPLNAWRMLTSLWGANLILVQETLHPAQYRGIEMSGPNVIFKAAPDRDWGSAIATSSTALEEWIIPGLSAHCAAGIGKNVRLGSEVQDIAIVSVHMPSPYEKNCTELIETIAKVRPSIPLILGGDFNVTTAFRERGSNPPNNRWELAFLEVLQEKLGLVNAWQALHGGSPLPQTLRWSGNPATAYHCDAIFIDRRLRPYLKSAAVIEDPDWARLTDHNPILIEFAVQ